MRDVCAMARAMVAQCSRAVCARCARDACAMCARCARDACAMCARCVRDARAMCMRYVQIKTRKSMQGLVLYPAKSSTIQSFDICTAQHIQTRSKQLLGFVLSCDTSN